jgi:hypothetical protein
MMRVRQRRRRKRNERGNIEDEDESFILSQRYLSKLKIYESNTVSKIRITNKPVFIFLLSIFSFSIYVFRKIQKIILILFSNYLS